jgi:hypothetical protein
MKSAPSDARGPDGWRSPPGLDLGLWRARLRIGEGLSLTEGDLDPMRGAILVRRMAP